IVGEVGQSERTSAGTPLSITSDCNNERSVRRIEELIWYEVRVRISPPLRIDPRDQDILRDVDERCTRAVRKRDVDATLFDGQRTCFAFRHGGENRNGRILSSDNVGESDADFRWCAFTLACDCHPAALSLNDEVISRSRVLGPESGNRAPDQRSMSVEQLFRIEAEAVERSMQKIVEDDVGL